MAKKVLGFLGTEDKEKVQSIKVRNIDKAFVKMAEQLAIEEVTQRHILSIEKKLRKKLVVLHKKILILEKKISKREALSRRMYAKTQDFPQQSKDLLQEVTKVDGKIRIEAGKIQEEVNKLYPKELSEIFKGLQLSDIQEKHLRITVSSMGTRLNDMMSSINNFGPMQVDNLSRNINDRIEILKK